MPKVTNLPSAVTTGARMSVVIPFYNERDYLPTTLACLVAQTQRNVRLILVDNDSTDGTAALSQDILRDHPEIDAVVLHEPRHGKIHALEAGLAAVDTEFVAFWDADTVYPDHYLGLCSDFLDQAPPSVVGVMAIDLFEPPNAAWSRVRRYYHVVISRILTKQAHTGGYGQTFRTQAIKAVGGYSSHYWPHVLEDHEVMHRVFKIGSAPHHADLWCLPSQRRTEQKGVRWTLFERLLYHFTPYAAKDWFFYRFLDRRFTRRGLDSLNLRQKTWIDHGLDGGPDITASDTPVG